MGANVALFQRTSIHQIIPMIKRSYTSNSFLLVTLLLATSSIDCHDFGDDFIYNDEEGVQLRAASSSLYVTNNTAETIYYFGVERQTSAVVDWITGCDTKYTVQSRITREIPYSEIVGFKKGCQAFFYWWHCSGTAIDRPGAFRTILFQTPG
jgi:hypothetical protein